MKKLWLVIMTSLLIFTIAAPSIVDAKGGRSYRSPSGSFKRPVKPATPNENVARTQKPKPASGTTNPANRGFFSGGGLMRGLVIGGLAGLLFGGMFGSMGALGDIFGFLINIVALYLLFVIIRRIVVYFVNRRKTTNRRS